MSHIVCLTSYELFASWCYGMTVSQRTQATFMPFHPNAFETLSSNLKSLRLHKKFVSAQVCSFFTCSASLLGSIILKNHSDPNPTPTVENLIQFFFDDVILALVEGN